jgi:hypothetical protein
MESGQHLSEDEAANLFIQRVVGRAYRGAIHDLQSLFQQGPPGRRPHERDVQIHQWYQGLAEADRQYVHRVVEETAQAAVFGVMVILDGATGGPPIRGAESDFALYIQSYPDRAAHQADRPAISVRVNPYHTLEDLHDRFLWAIEDQATGPSGQSDSPR